MPELSGAQLKAWRLASGLSQATVAKRLAISRSHYGNVESGQRPLMPRLRQQLADAYPGLASWLAQKEEVSEWNHGRTMRGIKACSKPET